MEEFLQVGIITKTHGIHGEVKVFPTTDDPKRFKRLKEVWVEGKNGKQKLEPESAKFFKNMVILKFKEFQTPEEVQPYIQSKLLVTRENAVRLQKDEYFIADLIGLKVLDESKEYIGELIDVMQTGANDVYVVRLVNGEELLLPAIKECILEINMAEGFALVHVMEGLM